MSYFDGAITVLFVASEAPYTSLNQLITQSLMNGLYMFLNWFLHVKMKITDLVSQKALQQQAYKFSGKR